MNVELNYEQRARIELLSMHAGKPSSQLLYDAAMMLLDRDSGTCENCRLAGTQSFIADDKLDARFAQLLRR